MDNETTVPAENENQHVDGSSTENAASSTDDKYLSQKIRAEKAEKALRELKAKLAEASTEKPDVTPAPAAQSALSKEETILYAKGHTEAEVEYAKKIASVEGSSPLAAAESDMFKTWKKIQDDKRKADDAQLGAASGSSVRRSEKSFGDKLTPEEHRALATKKFGLY
jgi:hypothetical protein